MGAERCIVLLVVVVMGAGLFVVNSVVDEDIVKNYSEEVAAYNELHDETLLDNVMHERIHSENDEGELAKEANRIKRSSGQGIDEDPEHDQEVQNYKRASRSVKDTNVLHTKTKRSSGQGMNEDPEHDQDEQNNNRASRSVKDNNVLHTKTKRSSGQGIKEDPDHARVERSSGQGMNEDPEHDGNRYNVASWLRSTENMHGVRSNIEKSAKPIPEKSRPKRSSGQGINEVDSSFFETASNLDLSVEDDNGAEEDEEFPGDSEQYNPNIPSSSSELSDIVDSDEQDGEADDVRIGGMLPDSEQPKKTLSEELIPCDEEFKSENGNDGDGISHYDNNLSPYAYHYEREIVDVDRSEDHPQIGYVLYNSENDDDRIIKLNKGIDFVLGLMSTMFTGEGELTVDLPDINKKFGHGIMAGNFNATQGYFKNPATLHRTGDVAITKLGDTVSLEVALGLQTLDAGFQHYDLKILKIHQAGTIDVSVAQNSIKMKISLTYAPACNLTVDYVGLDQLDGIKVNITGLGAFQSMFDMLSKWFLDNFTGDFKNIVNKKLAEKAKKAVAREDICKYFPQ